MRNQLITLREFPLYAICYFSLVAFNILSLSLIFVSFITICLVLLLLGYLLPGNLCASWTWLTISFLMFRKFLDVISSNIFLGPFCLSSPSGTPVVRMLVHLMLFQRFLGYFHLFFFFILFCGSDIHCSVL